MDPIISAFSGLVLAVTLALFVYQRSPKSNLPFPPGPKPKFFSRNVDDIPKTYAWLGYAAMAKEYGPLIHLKVGMRRNMLVINSAQVATDLLESRSGIYSDRPKQWMYGVLANRFLNVFNISIQHSRFRRYRKLMSSGLNPRATQGYAPLMESEVKTLLRALYTKPEELSAHVRRNAGAVILKVAYGWKVETNDDYFVMMMEKAVKMNVEANTPGKWLVEDWPALRYVPSWFPGAYFQRRAKYFREQLSHIDAVPFEWVKKQMASGSYIDSFTSRMLQPDDGTLPNAEEQDIIKWCSGALYAGGADTTVSALASFVAAMALYPEFQERARAEVDSVVGRDRLPTLEDVPHLHYVNAVVKEVLRWAPVAPMGLPHRLTQDDVYEGQFIPANTTVYANIWAILHDPALYPEPEKFNPDRHLGEHPQPDPRKYAFGFSRRVCPGAHFAETSLTFTTSSVLSSLIISKKKDANGKVIEPIIEFTSSVTSHLKPSFQCDIVPRSAGARALIEGDDA